MKTEKAMHLALLLGRLRDSYKKQILLTEEMSGLEEDFFFGWQCALQEDTLLRALRALNQFLEQEGLPILPEYPSGGESLEEWRGCLRDRYRVIDRAYLTARRKGLDGLPCPEDLFPELEDI